MADYRDRDVDGEVVDNPVRAFVSSSSTGIHTLKAVTSDGDGIQHTHVMGEYRTAGEAQEKVDAYNESMLEEIPDARPAAAPVLNSSEKDQETAALKKYIQANPADLSMKDMYPAIHKELHGE